MSANRPLEDGGERAAQAERFYVSKRHTMEVDFDEWMRDAQREMSRGAQRAADGRGPAAVPSRAASA